jgi:hypothetical protein
MMRKNILLKSLEFILRFFCVLIFLNMLGTYSELFLKTLKPWSNFSADVFLLFLLFFVIYSIKKFSKSTNPELEIFSTLGWIKWILLLFLTAHIIIDYLINSRDSQSNFYPKFLSAIIIPNLGLLIISLLLFYFSALLEERNKLKQEQDLTI